MDFILNGQANGNIATTLMNANMDANALRPWIGSDGRSYVTVIQNGVPTSVPTLNATATLRKDDWKLLDTAVVKAAQSRLRAVADLRSAGLVYNIPNGMGKMVLETETQSDINDATVSMDGLREGKADRPLFELGTLPLPIIHKDFFFSARQVMASRNGGSPLDTTTAELAGRKCAEAAEKMLLGVSADDLYSYGGGIIYGYTDYEHRQLETLSDPTDSAWTPKMFVTDVLSMKQKSMNQKHYGPWMLYTAPAWDQYLDQDYSDAKGDNTLRERVKKIEGIQDVRTLDFLTGYDVILVQMTSDVVREVIGMDFTTVQWESKGGMQLNFKVMGILVPQIRADQAHNSGIVHGSVA